MNTADNIERVLTESRRSLFAEQIAEEATRRYNVKLSSEQINATVTSEPDRFSYHSNGSIMLHYEKVFWLIADKIRNQQTSSKNAVEPIIIFTLRLLSRPELLVKLDLEPKDYSKLNLEEAAKKLISDLNEITNLLANQLDEYIKQINRVQWNKLTDVISNIKLIPDYYFGVYYAELFRSFNRYKLEFTEPSSVSAELMSALAATLPDGKVFDPFAGIGSFIIELNKIRQPNNKQHYLLNDIANTTCVYGKMNLFLNGIENFTFTSNDAFAKNHNVRADIILTNPPFFSDRDVKKVVDCVLNQLSDDGQALIIMPDSYLFSPVYKKERDMLIRTGLIRSVISLPASLFKPYASVKTSVIHISKKEYITKSTLFIKTYDQSVESLRDNISSLVYAFTERKTQEGLTQLVDIEEVLKNNVNLSVPLYFTQTLRSYGNYELGQVLKSIKQIGSFRPISRDIVNDQRIGLPIIRASNLADSPNSIFLDLSKVKNFSNQLQGVQLPKNTLLLALNGPTLRPTLVDSEDNLIVDGRSVIPFHITEKVLSEYLIYHLNEEDILTQVRAYYQGVTYQYIRREDLLKIRIHIPRKDEQRRYIDEKRRSLGLNLVQAREEIAYERFSTLKHSMAQPLRTLSSDFSTLLAYLEEKSLDKKPISLADYIAPIFDGEELEELEKLRLSKVTIRINQSVKYLQNSLNKVDALIKTSVPLDAKPVQLRQLLEKVLDMNKDNTYTYKVIGPDVTIKADQFLLEAAFSYLIENAVKHGFDYNQAKDKNSIVAEISERKFSNVEIILMNNGRRMADEIDNEYIFEKGRTSDKQSGSGFGGFVVNEIIKKHQGVIELFSRSGDAFPVQFKITLPI